jgi:hypothetical protein
MFAIVGAPKSAVGTRSEHINAPVMDGTWQLDSHRPVEAGVARAAAGDQHPFVFVHGTADLEEQTVL